ncbi:hypothetical protein GIB67_010622 [Kingdonia uniflora]|uniref:Uncharacterized protein n=1 Tax=Kingdonia uniflora TaxID=39325 RepID=A0A7J7M8D7_9MAGN|nr:hypothetical protein GIB67_010622 [Kingdonia uniflora]
MPEVASDALRLMPRQVSTQTEKGKGQVAPEVLKVQQLKVSQRKRHRALGVDDAVDEDEEMMEDERQEHAVAKKASMVELCENDPDEASKEIKRHMFQQTEAWVRSFYKVMKSVKGKLRQAVETLDLSRGTEASLLSGVKKLKQDLEMKEADVVDEAAGGTGSGVETSVIRVASGGTVDYMVFEGSKSSTEAVVGVGAEGPVEEEGVTVPI